MDDHPAQRAVQQCQCLQRLAEVVTGHREEATLRLIGAIGTLAGLVGRLPRPLCRLPCESELCLHALAIRDVANGRRDEYRIGVLDRTQADLDRELAAVPVL